MKASENLMDGKKKREIFWKRSINEEAANQLIRESKNLRIFITTKLELTNAIIIKEDRT